ncbi:hypothetical protein GGQ80_001539 [Sphingomonas jinjuensis]|uniref:Uncharacterized protein n=1 Tax=Sphingomonas jinjuensis TaxID=535907 RepID=A0A840F2Q9_9SPHN|nr:hypothetical protein [Sphingomonas jinjuensis]
MSLRRGRHLDRSGTRATATWLWLVGALVIGGRRDPERRRQAVGVDAIGLALRLDRRCVAAGTATAARRYGCVSLKHGFGAIVQRFVLRRRVRAVLPGDFLTILAPRTFVAIAALATLWTLAALRALATGFLTVAVPAVAAIVVAVAIAALAVLLAADAIAVALLLAGTDRLALIAEIVVAIEIEIVARLDARLLLILEPAPLVGEHAEIMIRELEVIFCGDAVALALRIRREILVLLEKLGGVAARAVVDPITAVATSLAALALAVAATTITAATATPAAVLPIVDQATVLVLRTKTGLAPASRCKPSGLAAWRKADR